MVAAGFATAVCAATGTPQSSQFETVSGRLYEDARPVGPKPETRIRFEDDSAGDLQVVLRHTDDGKRRELEVWSLRDGVEAIYEQYLNLVGKNPAIAVDEAVDLLSQSIRRETRLVEHTSRLARLIEAGPKVSLPVVIRNDDIVYIHGCRYRAIFRTISTETLVVVNGPPLKAVSRSAPFLLWMLDVRDEALRVIASASK